MTTITHPPVYPAFLAALFWVFGDARTWVVPILLSALSAATPILLYLWARRISGETTARAAGIWMALDPLCIFFSPQYRSETLFLFLSLWFFYELQRRLEREDSLRSAGTGFLGAATTLCRGTFAGYLPFLLLALGFLRRWRLLAFMAVAWVGVLLGWGLRNQRVHGAFIPISVQSGWNMYEGFTLDREELRERPRKMTEEVRRLGLKDPIHIDRHFRKKIHRQMYEHPGESVRIICGKLLSYWRPWPYEPYPVWLRWVAGLYLAVLLGLAAYGVVLSRRQAQPLLPIYAYFAALSILHAVYFTSLRYRMPLHPFIGFFAVWAGWSLWEKKGGVRMILADRGTRRACVPQE